MASSTRFRSAGTANFDQGPSTWARMRAKLNQETKRRTSKSHCQIALDTNIDLNNDPKLSGDDFYLMPSKSDVLFEKEFNFVSAPPQMVGLDSEVEEDGEWIETQKWVADWITDVLQQNGFRQTQTERHRVWSKYFTIVEIFGFAQSLPEIIRYANDNGTYSPMKQTSY